MNQMDIRHRHDHSYYKDYLSDLNIGFIETRLSKGDSMDLKFIRNNYIFFLLKGSIILSCEEFKDRTLYADEMILLRKSANYTGYAAEDAYMIVLIYNTPIYLYDKMWLESLATYTNNVNYNFKGLAINEPMKLFLQLQENYLKDNIDSIHLYEMKQKEFFLILQSYYTRNEQISFLYPSIGKSLDFRNNVMANYLIAKNSADLAQLCGYSVRTFSRKFVAEFGEPPYSWMQKQIAKHVKYQLLEKYTSFKNIAEEFHFSSIEQFIRFCKIHFGDTPSVFRSKNATKY